MLIRNKDLLDKYVIKHAGIRNALQHWIDFVEGAEWKSHNELKQDFPSVDYVGNSTHAEYDKIDCKNI
jgi:mRNA interferase HigB